MKQPPHHPRQRTSPRRRNLLKIVSLGLAGLLAGLLSGCGPSTTSIAATSYARVAGNWQFTPSTPSTPALAGSLNVNGSSVSGMLHPLPSAACPAAPATPATGAIDDNGTLSLTSPGFNGGALALTGTLAPDQKSLLNARYTVSGGSCPSPKDTTSSGTQYTPISGTYTGTVASHNGSSTAVTALFTQTSQPDANGAFHLEGQATFDKTGQTCLDVPVVSDSVVTGSTLAAVYTQGLGSSAVTVTVSGTFNPDASVLTLSSYAISGGGCNGDTGSGTLTRQ